MGKAGVGLRRSGDITERDFLKGGKTVYHAELVLRETGAVISDGRKEIFVNAAVDDGTRTADLMECFMRTKIDTPAFPALSKAVDRIKNTEGGADAVCDIMRHYEKLAEERGEAIGKAKGKLKTLISTVRALMETTNRSAEAVLDMMKVSKEDRGAVLAAI